MAELADEVRGCVGGVSSHSVNGPPLSETKTSNEAIPEPPGSSWPDQETARWSRRRSGQRQTPFGVPASMVFSTVGVSIGSFQSKTIVAMLVICVPDGSPAFGLTM